MGNSIKKLGNKLILFEIAKTNNEMMSSVLSNSLGWPEGNSSKQVRFIHMHASNTIPSHWLNQHKLAVVCRHLRPIAD